jgi:hypothetical protein
VIDPKLSKDVTTITLSYTFFEVGGKTPAAPSSLCRRGHRAGANRGRLMNQPAQRARADPAGPCCAPSAPWPGLPGHAQEERILQEDMAQVNPFHLIVTGRHWRWLVIFVLGLVNWAALVRLGCGI